MNSQRWQLFRLSWPSWLSLPMLVAPLSLVIIYITATGFDLEGLLILYWIRLWERKKESLKQIFFNVVQRQINSKPFCKKIFPQIGNMYTIGMDIWILGCIWNNFYLPVNYLVCRIWGSITICLPLDETQLMDMENNLIFFFLLPL